MSRKLDISGLPTKQQEAITRILQPKKVDISVLDEDTQHAVFSIALKNEINYVRHTLKERKKRRE